MTLATWTPLHYTTSARLFLKEAFTPTNKLAAVEHSLKKWEGLRPEVLAKHGLTLDRNNNVNDVNNVNDLLNIDSTTCALCALVLHREAEDEHGYECDSCPLAEARGGYACDCSTPDEIEDNDDGDDEYVSPWDMWQCHGDPEPMIAALKAAHALLLRQD